MPDSFVLLLFWILFLEEPAIVLTISSQLWNHASDTILWRRVDCDFVHVWMKAYTPFEALTKLNCYFIKIWLQPFLQGNKKVEVVRVDRNHTEEYAVTTRASIHTQTRSVHIRHDLAHTSV